MGAEHDMAAYADIFRRAARIVGGESQLCSLLQVSKAECEAWINGQARPSPKALIKVMNVLLAHVESQTLKR